MVALFLIDTKYKVACNSNRMTYTVKFAQKFNQQYIFIYSKRPLCKSYIILKIGSHLSIYIWTEIIFRPMIHETKIKL